MAAITGIGHTPAITPGAAPSTKPAGAAAQGFGDALNDLLGAVDTSSSDANAAVGRMLDGSGDVHEAVIAIQKADTMLQLTVQIRNKIVQAYQDVMRMPM
jgi:flagellar hook-basal body complex protein FliE